MAEHYVNGRLEKRIRQEGIVPGRTVRLVNREASEHAGRPVYDEASVANPWDPEVKIRHGVDITGKPVR